MKDKVVVFSDGLDLEMVRRIEEEGERLEGLDGEFGGGGVKRSYGVGTWLTNDFEKVEGEGKSKALNIVSVGRGLGFLVTLEWRKRGRETDASSFCFRVSRSSSCPRSMERTVSRSV